MDAGTQYSGTFIELVTDSTARIQIDGAPKSASVSGSVITVRADSSTQFSLGGPGAYESSPKSLREARLGPQTRVQILIGPPDAQSVYQLVRLETVTR